MNDKLSHTVLLPDEAATVAAGAAIGQHLQAGMTIFLEGTLGAGKTTLTRGILRSFGHSGAVKSPTYTLVENYDEVTRVSSVYHFDLYRLGDPEELEYMGIRDYFSTQSICIVEWAERGQGYLPTPDLLISLSMADQPLVGVIDPADVEKENIIGRELTIASLTPLGQNSLSLFCL